MNNPKAVIAFSVTAEQLHFEIEGHAIDVDQGLDFIVSKSIRFGRFDAMAVENIIYVIEELLEQLKLDDHMQRTAQTSDAFMRQLAALFFSDAQHIDRSMLEHAFNEWVERLEYYADKAGSDFKLLAYFVLIREMMHHLNVVEITIVNR